MWGCKILCENLWWLWARQEQPILTLSANFVRRGDSLLVVGQGLLLPPAVGLGCLLHPFAACSAAGALRNVPAGAALCAPAVFAPRFARLRGDSRWWWGKVATSTHSPPVRRRANRGTSSLCAPAVFAPRFARLRGNSLLVVGQGCYLHPFAACSAAGEQRNILALRSGCFCTALRDCAAIAAQANNFSPKEEKLKKHPIQRGEETLHRGFYRKQDKPSRMDTMAQFTLSHMILIIVPCRDNGVNTTRNVAPRGIFCIFCQLFGQYVKTACKPLFSQRNISCRPSIFLRHSRFAFILSKATPHNSRLTA